MHNWFDQFVKEVLHEAFDPLGTAEQEVEISADAQRIDFFFVPGPKSPQAGEAGAAQALVPSWEGAAEVAEVPPIFQRMARTAYLLEHYRRSPSVRGVRGCLRKMLTQLHLEDLAAETAARESKPAEPGAPPAASALRPPAAAARTRGARILWVLSSGRPANVVSGFALRRLPGWPTGTYQGPLPALRYRLIVLNQLPETRYTLPLRLLGRGATFRQAMRELKKLPPSSWERQHIPRLLVKYRMETLEAASLSDLPPEEKELLVTVDEYLTQVKETGRQQGMQQGQRTTLLRQIAHKLARPLTDEERARVAARLDSLGPDRLGDVVLDLSPTALADWLADPDAK